MKNKKRALSFLMVLVTLCSVIALPALAASTTAFDILSNANYAKTYTLSNSGRTIPYTSSNLQTRGTATYGASSKSYIDNAADELYILDVGCANGTYWAYVSYPTSSRRVNAYIPLSAITANNASHTKTTSSGKFYCSLRESTASKSSYYVAKGDTVYLVATSGSKYQILYPTSGGKWRLAWCAASDYQKYCGSTASSSSTGNTSGMTDVTASFAGKTITLQSVENGKYLCAERDTANAPALCSRDSAADWETFTVSGMTSDGWVGLKAHANGKYLSAYLDATDTPIRAVADNLLSWECFRIYQKGNDYYLKAQVNNKWLCVRVDQKGAPVQAYAGAASTWERFHIRIVNQNTSSSQSTADTSWQMPMNNAYCTWKSKENWSWATYTDRGSNRSYHMGVDMYGSNGTVYAAAGGKVVAASSSSKGANGRYIVIEHTLSGKTVYSFYAHLSSLNVSVGQTVSKGTLIGKAGGSGYDENNYYGIHLHFAVVDTLLTSGDYYGYTTYFTGNSVKYNNITFYNPIYVVNNGKLP